MSALSPTLDNKEPSAADPKQVDKPIGGSMTPAKTNLFVILAIVLLLVAIGIVARFSVQPIAGIASSTATITIISASAVGIERIIETFWTYIGLTRGSWWPLGPVREQLDQLLSGLDTSFEPFYEEAHTTMQTLQQAKTWSDDKLNAAAKDLDKIKQHVDDLKKLPIDSQRVQLIADSAARSISYFSQKYPEIKDAAELAGLGIQGVNDFVETFKDNPGRRLISLFAGCLIGLVIAGVVGMDIFQAVLQTPITAEQSVLFPRAGVAVTGLLMGLGANPTHEAIRLLQEIKKQRKTENAQ
jgi:hypothetical protein